MEFIAAAAKVGFVPVVVALVLLLWAGTGNRRARLWMVAGGLGLLLVVWTVVGHAQYERPDGPWYAGIPAVVLPIVVVTAVVDIAQRKVWPIPATVVVGTGAGLAAFVASVMWGYTQM